MRKLDSIQKIKSLEPISGADSIEMARVLGWQLVVKKGEFQVNDFCVYFEIDSILPVRAEFEFLRPRSCGRIWFKKSFKRIFWGFSSDYSNNIPFDFSLISP